MPKTYTITEKQRRLIITVAAQVDYACEDGDWDCLEASAHNAALLLKSFGEKTAAEERAEEEEEDDEDDA
jgi:hypothetical protein